MVNSISVQEWLKKATNPNRPVTSDVLRATVVCGAAKDEAHAGKWISEEVMAAVKAGVNSNLGVANFHLPGMKIVPCMGCYGGGGRVCSFPCDRNDSTKTEFDESDEMPNLHQHLIDSDILLVVADSRWGGLNHHVQGFIERMNSFANQSAANKPLLKNKVAGVVVVGDSPMSVVGQLMAALNAFGYCFPQYAYVAWATPRVASAELVKAAFDKAVSVHTDAKLLGDDLVRFARLLKGV